jgi:hypothetical protein
MPGLPGIVVFGPSAFSLSGGTMPRFRIQVQNAKGLWSTVNAASGEPLEFAQENDARAEAERLFPVETGVARYAGPKTVRVVIANPYQDLDEAEEDEWKRSS